MKSPALVSIQPATSFLQFYFIHLHSQNEMSITREPVFVDLLRSPGIDSQPGGIDALESIPGLLKRLQIR